MSSVTANRSTHTASMSVTPGHAACLKGMFTRGVQDATVATTPNISADVKGGPAPNVLPRA